MSELSRTCSENPENTFRVLDVVLPEQLIQKMRESTQEIHDDTRIQLTDCLVQTLQIDCPLSGFKNMFIEKLYALLQQDPAIISDTQGEVIQELVYQTAQEYLNQNPTFVYDPEQSYIMINNYVINFSHIGRRQADTGMKSSPRPRARPENLQPQYVEKTKNKFEELQESGFSPTMKNFIKYDFFPKVAGEGVHFEEKHLQRIQRFVEFLIDMETSGGTQLVNKVSTATGYTQTLNEEDSSRQEGRFNSIDTRLRYASQFYDAGEIISNTELPIDTQVHPRAAWVENLWNMNTAGKPMIDFSFDSEIRLTLIFLFQKNPEAMKDIVMGKNDVEAAKLLYQAHHTNIDGQKNTQMVMFQKILQHYG